MTSADGMRPARGVPLRRRLMLVTLAVAVVAVVATGVATLQLSRSADATVARAELAAQAERLANAPPGVRDAAVDGLAALTDDVRVAVIDDVGAATGSGADLVVPRILRQLRAGDSVSTIVRNGGFNYLVEAVPIDSGGGVLLAQNAATVRSIGRLLTGPFLIALGIGIAVAVGAAVLATRTLSRPLLRLAATARRLAAGDRALPAAQTGVRELDEVAEAISVLDRALEHSEARQREFLLTISHEIRTPLTALRGYAEALADGAIPAEEVATVGRTLHAEAMRLTSFTDDLLALARLEADDFRLDLADVALGDLLAGAAGAWRATADAANIRLELSVADGLPPVRSDPARLRQVVDGLLENALRVSPAGTTIRLGAHIDTGAVVIEIADGGPGIEPADLARAFERGYLRDRYQGSRSVGSGLGLSIAARLVERLGGTIAVQPAPSGTIFAIRLAVP